MIKAERLTKSFYQAGREIDVLSGIDLVVKSSDSVAILGVSGSGKSTLLHLLAGLDKADSGKVLLKGLDLNELSERQRGTLRNQHVGFVYQFHHLLPELSTLENIALPALLSGKNRDQAYLKSRELLDQIGLKTKENNSPSELSGGERQRVAIARAISNNPSCLIMDEPTGNLDSKNVKVFMDMLTDIIVENGTTLIIATHDQNVSSRLDRLLSLE